jgi:hypothetical protein
MTCPSHSGPVQEPPGQPRHAAESNAIRRIGHSPDGSPIGRGPSSLPLLSRLRGATGGVRVGPKTRERQRTNGVTEIPSRALLACLTARRSCREGGPAGGPLRPVSSGGSLSTLPGEPNDAPMPGQGIRVTFSGFISGVLRDGERSICWVADKTGKVHSGEGKLLLGHAQQGRTGSGDGRRIVSRPARVRQPISGSGRPRRISVSRRRGGGGRPRGRRSA